MAEWVHSEVLDQGIAFVKTNCDKMAVISSYAEADSYATVAGRILAETPMNSADFTLGTSGGDRTLTTAAGKSAQSASASGGGASNHLAFVDTVNTRVLWVTAETSGQAVAAGNKVDFPSVVLTSKQSVAG